VGKRVSRQWRSPVVSSEGELGKSALPARRKHIDIGLREAPHPVRAREGRGNCILCLLRVPRVAKGLVLGDKQLVDPC
jgi:hypothetical protein